ncbi:MAG TPA: type II toxin-antitoxin system RelE/ParE family toxin [Actinomycetota bacterium]
MAPSAVRTFKKLPAQERTRIRRALEKLATEATTPGRIGGKSVKTIQGLGDSFHRLRVGDHRVMYDVLEEDRVILVLGVVDRGDLERWLRNR